MVSLQSCVMALTLTAALLPNLNTLPADFAFDDNFAVVGEIMIPTIKHGT